MMKLSPLLLFCFLGSFVFGNGELSRRSFILSGPKKFQKGSEETVCLSLFNGLNSGNATFYLKLSETESRDYHFSLGSADCFVLSIPDVPSSETASLAFQAYFDDGEKLSGVKMIKFKERSFITLIETDKPWYKPGQLIQFRTLSLDHHLKPVMGEFTQILLEDSTGYITELWENVSTTQGLVQLQFQLFPEPVQGTWKIKVIRGSQITQKDISVKEFELPRFELQLQVPSRIGLDQRNIEIEICARYTYGSPVKMNYTIVTVENLTVIYGWDDVDENVVYKKLEGKGFGCVKKTLTTSAAYEEKKISVQALVTEEDTGITLNRTAEIKVFSQTDFTVEVEKTFKVGIPVAGTVKALGTWTGSIVYIICLHSRIKGRQKRVCREFRSDESGCLKFSFLPTEISETTITIQVSIRNTDFAVTKHIKQIFSSSGHAIAFTQTEGYRRCGERLTFPLLFTGKDGENIRLYWQIISRGEIRENENIILSYDKADQVKNRFVNDINDSNPNDTFVNQANERLRSYNLSYLITDTDGPKLTAIAYATRPDGEVLTAVNTVDVKPCFSNKVEMRWADSKKKPGEKVKLSVSGQKRSFCGLSVVDKSVTLLQPEDQLQESTVFTKLSDIATSLSSDPKEVTPDNLYCKKELGMKGEYFETDHIDPVAAFDDAGLFVISNLKVESRPCIKKKRPQFSSKWRSAGGGGRPDVVRSLARINDKTSENQQNELELPEELTSAVNLRSYFPETWLWDGFTLSDEGSHERRIEVPHTITNWVGRAICLSAEAGFGMSPSVELQVFQLLFVELNLPYSVKRGETLVLKVSAFNYAKYALPIAVEMPSTIEFDIISVNAGQTKCVEPQTKAVYTFRIKPSFLGYVNVTVKAFIDDHFESECGPEVLPSASDTVIKPLFVIPEGLPVEKTYSSMICPKDFDEDKVTTWNVTLPSNTVEGSERGWVTIIGDLMGPAITGLGSLVRMPTGCGEQNMIIFTPIVYVLQYLKSTKQGDPELFQKSIDYLKTGYQRELSYRHLDGSYSAFGKSDASGSMWLTAFVVRSFAGAKAFIKIDETDFVKSFKWILTKQLENGCFPSVGKVFHSDLKGGISQDSSPVGLSAFVVASLIEAGVETSSDAIRKSLSCIQEANNQTDYVMALSTYVLAKAKETSVAIPRMDALLEGAKEQNDLLWWQQGESKSLWVEITAYNIMSLTLLSEKSEYKAKARSAVRWLAKQRNGNGGFFSTQDTVVGLQALALYSSSISQTKIDMDVTVVSTNLEEALKVKEERKLVQRQLYLPVLPTLVEIDAIGEGCVLVQVVSRYNTYIEKEKESFHITAAISTNLEMSGCVKFIEENQPSNMAVVDIEILSGYIPTKDSILSLKKDSSNGIKRTDVTDGHLYLYYDELNSVGRCFNFELEEQFEVADLKPASVVVYDYYATQKRATFEVQPPSLTVVP